MFERANAEMYKETGCWDWDMEAYCWKNGYWSWSDTIDVEGNIVDSYKRVTIDDFRDACEDLGLDFNRCYYGEEVNE